MITIEASNIYFGGGGILLELLLDRLEQKAIRTEVYIGYKELYCVLKKKNYNYILLKKTTAKETIFRYLRQRNNVLFFCSLPPFVKCKKSLVYFHNPYALSLQKITRYNIKFILYYYWVKLFKNNIDTFACQTKNVADKLAINRCKSILLPFYPATNYLEKDKIYDFCYISSVAPHKNHSTLFDAIEKITSNGIKMNIVVTVKKNIDNTILLSQIERINKIASHEVIINKGFISKKEVEEIYASSNALIFPSLKETFGLPIAEALSCGLKIITADRPYVHDLITNPIVFNPENVNEIYNAIHNQIQKKNEDIKQCLIIEDKLDELISILSSTE